MSNQKKMIYGEEFFTRPLLHTALYKISRWNGPIPNFLSFWATERLFISKWGRISPESDWCRLKLGAPLGCPWTFLRVLPSSVPIGKSSFSWTVISYIPTPPHPPWEVSEQLVGGITGIVWYGLVWFSSSRVWFGLVWFEPKKLDQQIQARFSW